MNSLLYVDVNVEQLKRLEEVDDVVTAKQLLSAMFGVPQDPRYSRLWYLLLLLTTVLLL